MKAIPIIILLIIGVGITVIYLLFWGTLGVASSYYGEPTWMRFLWIPPIILWIILIKLILYIGSEEESMIRNEKEFSIKNKQDRVLKSILSDESMKKEFYLIKEKLQVNENIVKMKNNNELKVITNSQHEINVELHMSNNYDVVINY